MKTILFLTAAVFAVAVIPLAAQAKTKINCPAGQSTYYGKCEKVGDDKVRHKDRSKRTTTTPADSKGNGNDT